MFHLAILYPTRAALGNALKRLKDSDVPLDGASDHGISQALHLLDPDGNGIELCWDREEKDWPRTTDGELAMTTRPLDLEGLLNAAE